MVPDKLCQFSNRFTLRSYSPVKSVILRSARNFFEFTGILKATTDHMPVNGSVFYQESLLPTQETHSNFWKSQDFKKAVNN